MSFIIRALHLLSLGLWLGGVAFFSFFTALPVIGGMQELATRPDNWVGLHTKEEGTRLAGEALTIVFARYFPFQVVVGLIAVLTGLLWPKGTSRLKQIRVVALAFALLLALANLLHFSPKVHDLRQSRYSTDSAVAAQASQEFGTWHTYSLVADMLGLVLVVTSTVLLAYQLRDETK